MENKKNNIPTIFVILGATGDLMSRKIIPSLFKLYKTGRLPKLSHFVAFSRRDLTNDSYREFVKDALTELQGRDCEDFLQLFSYIQGDFNVIEGYRKLSDLLGHIDGEWKTCSNKLFYLAVPPKYYEKIFDNLKISGLTIPCGGEDEGWTRIIVEKPFGKDFDSAQALDTHLGKLFKEEQIYRIDHYLAKEMIQNILSFRFSNSLFEEIWNNRFIEKIEVRILEDIGIEGRAELYDGIGTLRDVGQNHMLQMLSLVTMERPATFEATDVRKKRAAVLEDLEKMSVEEVKTRSFRAQFDEYQSLANVTKDSQTETYFRIVAGLSSSRFKGIPIILEAGKNLERKKEIIVTFKHPVPCFCPPGGEHYQNRIIFSLEPEEKILIEFWGKKPGITFEMEQQEFTFSYEDKDKNTESVSAYERLLLDCISGNQLLFVSTEEIAAMWQFIDPIESAWEKNEVPLYTYKPHEKEILEKAQIFEKQMLFQTLLKREIGVVGLGKMGASMAERLIEKDWNVVAYNRTAQKVDELVEKGATGAYTVEEMVKDLQGPRIVLLSVPDKAIDEVLFGEDGLVHLLEKDDIVLDFGNSFYKDSIKRYSRLKEKGIRFVDVGTSGGPTGARNGASLMVGGEKMMFDMLYPLYTDLSVADGVEYFEGPGAGHFVKMVHNGIEYGMMQSIAEGFSVMEKSQYNLDLENVADVYNHGSVIESRLVGWLQSAFEEYGQDLKAVSSTVAHTGEGDHTVETAKELEVPVKIIEESVNFRIESAKNPSYTGKILSALRNRFGGHEINLKAQK
jgi:glucose-6-phosphate 1-dehydrogenase